MTADMGVSDEAAAPLLPAASHIHQSEPHVMQPVRTNTLYSNKKNTVPDLRHTGSNMVAPLRET